MQFLHKAVQAGYKDTAHMKKDTDLDALRDREDFKKLLAELEKGAEKKGVLNPDDAKQWQGENAKVLELAPAPRERK